MNRHSREKVSNVLMREIEKYLEFLDLVKS